MNESGIDVIHQEKNIDFCPNIKSFMTELGSIYEKDNSGRFVRHKYDGSISKPQEFTLFIDQNKTGVGFQLLNYPLEDLRKNMTVMLMQGSIDDPDSLEPIYRRNQIRDPNSIIIQVLNFSCDINSDEFLGEQISASLIPYEGADVFEVNVIPKGEGFEATANSTHLGHKVTKIN